MGREKAVASAYNGTCPALCESKLYCRAAALLLCFAVGAIAMFSSPMFSSTQFVVHTAVTPTPTTIARKRIDLLGVGSCSSNGLTLPSASAEVSEWDCESKCIEAGSVCTGYSFAHWNTLGMGSHMCTLHTLSTNTLQDLVTVTGYDIFNGAKLPRDRCWENCHIEEVTEKLNQSWRWRCYTKVFPKVPAIVYSGAGCCTSHSMTLPSVSGAIPAHSCERRCIRAGRLCIGYGFERRQSGPGCHLYTHSTLLLADLAAAAGLKMINKQNTCQENCFIDAVQEYLGWACYVKESLKTTMLTQR